MRLMVVPSVLALVAGMLGVGHAQAPAAEVIPPVMACGELDEARFDIPGAATRIEDAKHVEASTGNPAYCDVRGVVVPAIGFQLKLPTETFTGRYLQYGCGGFCGHIFEPRFRQCGPEFSGDFAVAATDDGHVTQFPAPPGRFGENNQTARDDWFFRAPHVLSLAAKRIITTYYGSPPTRSYFDGCSNGGREGLLLAQRYPDDFDGIIAGHPVNFMSALGGVLEPWRARTNTDAHGGPILTDAKLPALHRAVMAACDGLDGLVDGQLQDPRACRFDPGVLRCPPGTDQPGCLTPAQVDVTRKLYAGPIDVRGQRFYPGGSAYGSEIAWATYITKHPALGVSIAEYLGDNYRKYLGYPIGTPHSSVADFRLTPGDFHRLTPEGRKPNAMSLDLEKFRRLGGKLILWHGWSDPDVPPAGTLDYYQRLTERFGGLARTQTFARVFMVPSMFHCFNGSRLTDFDALPGLVRWVENGTVPDKVIAVGRDAWPDGPIVRTRPVFAYPLQARYGGSGSTDDASNFVPFRPPTRPNDKIHWLGTYLHNIPGPVAR